MVTKWKINLLVSACYKTYGPVVEILVLITYGHSHSLNLHVQLPSMTKRPYVLSLLASPILLYTGSESFAETAWMHRLI